MNNFNNPNDCIKYIDENTRDKIIEEFNDIYSTVFLKNNLENLQMNIFFLVYAQKKYKITCETLKKNIFSIMKRDRRYLEDLSWIYILVCENTEEIEIFLDKELIGKISDKNISDLISTTFLINYILNDLNNISKIRVDKNKYKNIIAQLLLQQVSLQMNVCLLEGYPHLLKKIVECQKIFKEVDNKTDLLKAKQVQQELDDMLNNKTIFPNTHTYVTTTKFEIPQKNIDDFKNVLLPLLLKPKDLVEVIINGINVNSHFKFYPFLTYTPRKDNFDIFRMGSSENGTLKKPIANDITKYLAERKIHSLVFYKSIYEVIQSSDSCKDIFDYILSSNLIFDEDYHHISLALNLLKDKKIVEFIYLIIPNFEKLLRNLLVFNNIQPTKIKNSGKLTYQNTITLSESITLIKTHHLLDEELIFEINSTLNDDTFENYRNKVSHKLENEVFSESTALDLFILLINLLFNTDRIKSEITGEI